MLTNRTYGVHLATAVSQKGFNVFHVANEMNRRGEDDKEHIFTGDESEYFVHRRHPGESCIIHNNCRMTLLSECMPENTRKRVVASSLYNIARLYNDTV
jgi:hypothetical protein